MMPEKREMIGTLCGLLSPCSFAVGYAISWSRSPWYVVGNHYLSDLGAGEGAVGFNAGLILAGFLIIPFAWRLLGFLKEYKGGKVGSFLLGITGISLSLVGVFPEPVGRLHHYVSVLFFTLLFLTLLLLAWPMMKSRVFRKSSGPLTIFLLLSSLLILPFGVGPLMETIVVYEAIIWCVVAAAQSMPKMASLDEKTYKT